MATERCLGSWNMWKIRDRVDVNLDSGLPEPGSVPAAVVADALQQAGRFIQYTKTAGPAARRTAEVASHTCALMIVAKPSLVPPCSIR